MAEPRVLVLHDGENYDYMFSHNLAYYVAAIVVSSRELTCLGTLKLPRLNWWQNSSTDNTLDTLTVRQRTISKMMGIFQHGRSGVVTENTWRRFATIN